MGCEPVIPLVSPVIEVTGQARCELDSVRLYRARPARRRNPDANSHLPGPLFPILNEWRWTGWTSELPPRLGTSLAVTGTASVATRTKLGHLPLVRLRTWAELATDKWGPLFDRPPPLS